LTPRSYEVLVLIIFFLIKPKRAFLKNLKDELENQKIIMPLEALVFKEAGNLYFSKRDFSLSCENYQKGIALILADNNTPLSSDLRELLVTLYSNNALSLLKLCESYSSDQQKEYLVQAEDSCTLALRLNPAHAKSLYRRALSLEGLGGKTNLRKAIDDASRALQIERNDAVAADLLKRLRKKLEEADAPLSITACLELLSCNTSQQHDELFSVSKDDEEQPSIIRILRSLQTILMTGSGQSRIFIESNGIHLLLSVLCSPKASVNNRLTGFSFLSTLATKTIDTYTHEWQREWDVLRSKNKSLGLVDILADQLSLAEKLASAGEFTLSTESTLSSSSSSSSLSLLKVSTEDISTTSALSRLSVSLLCASLAVLRPQLRTQLAVRLTQWREIKNGSLTTIIKPPFGIRNALSLWSKSAATLLNRGSRGIEGGKLTASLASNTSAESSTTVTAARVLVTLQGVGQLIQAADGAAEDCVNIFDSERVMENVADWLSSGPADVRRTAAGALTRALTVLRSSHARGHASLGEKKMQDFSLRLVFPGISSLARALPNRIEIKVASEVKSLGGKDPEAAAKVAAESAEVQEKKRIEEEGAHLLPRPDWNADENTGKTASVLLSSLQVDFRCGYWLAEQDAVLPAVFISSGSPETHILQACGDSIAALCSEETGRSLLSTVPQRILSSDPSASLRLDLMSLLRRLSESSVPSVRSGAAVTMAKLTAPSKGFSAPEGRKGREEMIESTVRLLIASSNVLRRQEFKAQNDTFNSKIESEEAINDVHVDVDDELDEDDDVEHEVSSCSFRQMIDNVRDSWISSSISTIKNKQMSNVKSNPILVHSVDINGAARAVEALAVLATHTETKARLSTDKACLRALLNIGAYVCALVGLQKALLSASSANTGTESTYEEKWERSIAPGISIDLRKLPDSVRADACKSELRPTLYGLAHILFSITTSRERLQKAKLAELDVDMDQWKELQRLTMPRAEGDGGAAIKSLGTGFVEEVDPPEDVERRTKSLLSNDVLHLIANIADAAKGLKSTDSLESSSISASKATSNVPLVGSSMTENDEEGVTKKFNLPQPAIDNTRNGAATRELVSLFLLQVSENQWARGIILQGGAAPLLIELAHDGSVSDAARAAAFNAGAGTNAGAVNPAAASSGRLAPANTTQGSLAAAQALARVLITTNPTLLSSSTLLDSVGPLVRLAREGMTALSLFESGMALTNLASCGVQEVRKSLITRRGLAALEDLQFSSHKMVRRAGTEAITNLSTTPEGAGLILRSRVKLWLALSRSYQAVGAIIEDGSGITMSTKAEKIKKKKRGQEILKAAGANTSSVSLNTTDITSNISNKVTSVDTTVDSNTKENEEEEEEEIDRDTPTALAAAGALAMASNSFISHANEEEDEGPEVETSRKEFANILVGADTVSCMTELLLSGHIGLAHRAAMVLMCLSEHPSGAAALLSPIRNDETGTLGIDPFSILFILSQGVNLDSGMEAASKAMKATKKGFTPNPNMISSPAVMSLAKRAVQFSLVHSKEDIEKGAKEAALAWHRVDEANIRSETTLGKSEELESSVIIEDITEKVNMTSKFLKPVFPVGQLGRHLWTVESILEMIKDEDEGEE
jgi:hypothetical protein